MAMTERNGTDRAPVAAFVLDGEEIALPVEVRSAKMVAAQYVVDADAAQALVDYSGLRVARQPGGRAMVALSAVQYTDNDLGPYHEFAVAVVVEPHDALPGYRPSFTKVTTLIHRLPVNQHYTCRVGKGLWGFPKWVTDITYTERSTSTRCTVVDDGEFVLSFDVGRGWLPLPSSDVEMACYSWDDGVLRRTPWTTRSRRMRARVGGATITLGSHHPMATELRSLGLPKSALMATGTPLMTATFGAPEVVRG
jgi:hypothetical protein